MTARFTRLDVDVITINRKQFVKSNEKKSEKGSNLIDNCDLGLGKKAPKGEGKKSRSVTQSLWVRPYNNSRIHPSLKAIIVGLIGRFLISF